MIRTVEELKAQAAAEAITFYPVHECSFCGYMCGYRIDGESVCYDSGCDCTGSINSQPRSWEDLAETYNRNQPENNPGISETYLKRLNQTWQFDDMTDTTNKAPVPNQSERLDEILWPAIAGSVNASINAPDGVIDTTDKSIEHFETAKAAIQAMILEAQIQEIEREYVLHVDLMSSRDYKDGFSAACDQIDDSVRLRIADLKAQLSRLNLSREQLKGVQG